MTGLKPLTPKFWTDPSEDGPELEAVLAAIERTTASDRGHTQRVELGWVTPDNRPLTWKYWKQRSEDHYGGCYFGKSHD